MSAFSEPELAYLLDERRLGRVATVGKDGTPHVVPVGWSYNADQDSIDVGGRELERTKKYRDVRRSGRAAIVVDDLASTDPWPREARAGPPVPPTLARQRPQVRPRRPSLRPPRRSTPRR